jgi:hypothetical protein
MTEQKLIGYVEQSIRAGASRQTVVEQLTAVGWSEDEAESAYAAGLIAVGVPVPQSSTAGLHLKKASAMDVVLNFFSFILLGIVASALGTLYFAVINHFFPDPLRTGYYYYGSMSSSSVHYAIAALLIAFPMYYVAVRLWFKRFHDDVAKVESKLTKWLTYLVLLAASITIVGDLIAVLYRFLQGEVSPRFFLKALTVLLIAGAIFGFYFLERKKVQYKQEIPRRTFQLFGIVLTALVVLGIILGFMVVGSPSTERNRAFDAQRAENLAELARCINNYATEYQVLPGSLAELAKTSYSYCTDLRDPETNAAYEYAVLAPLVTSPKGLLQGEFELCATFALPSDVADKTTEPLGYYGTGKWNAHGVGRECDTESPSINPREPNYIY